MTIVAPDAKAFFNELAIPAFDEAVLLFFQRKVKLKQRLNSLSDIEALDERLWNNLQHLLMFPDAVRALSEERFVLLDDADAFVSTYLAFTFNDEAWIQKVFAVYLGDEDCAQAIAIALAWMPSDISEPWIKPFLKSRDLSHKCLAIRTCRLTQNYHRSAIHVLAKREDCQKDLSLYREILLLVGDAKDRAMHDFVVSALSHDAIEIQAAAHRSLLLLGVTEYIDLAIALSLASNEHFHMLSPLLVRILPITESQRCVSKAFKSDSIALDLVILASAHHGDPQVIEWLTSLMENPLVSPLAGFAFYYLTGFGIVEHGLTLDDLDNSLATLSDSTEMAEAFDESNEMFLQEDHSLAIPDAKKVKHFWLQRSKSFVRGRRYFMGKEIDCTSEKGRDILLNHTHSPRLSVSEGANLELLLSHHLKGYSAFIGRLYPH